MISLKDVKNLKILDKADWRQSGNFFFFDGNKFTLVTVKNEDDVCAILHAHVVAEINVQVDETAYTVLYNPVPMYYENAVSCFNENYKPVLVGRFLIGQYVTEMSRKNLTQLLDALYCICYETTGYIHLNKALKVKVVNSNV